MIKLTQKHEWPTVEGTHVIGYQIEQQWKCWAVVDAAANLDSDGARTVTNKAAGESAAINFLMCEWSGPGLVSPRAMPVQAGSVRILPAR